ncbi:MAG: hypothetical protein JNL43_06595 [Flavobacteriales bacterium]|nr:hypothetical protein [Flavobacteriales bacterium]
MKQNVASILELACRWHVALSMFVYGIAKTVQFDATAGNDAPVNSLSGQQLMWAFYGYSLGYAKFLGVVEMLGAGLLLFRRTTLLGCLVVSSVLVNVIAQDITYGVNEGALRAALIYQMLTFLVVLLNRHQVVRIWKAFTSPVPSTEGLRWYWLVLGSLVVLAATLGLEHLITH